LKEIFASTQEEYYRLGKTQQVVPAEHPIDIHANLVNIAMLLHTDEIYSKSLTYQASFLRKCTKIYKETSMTMHNFLVDDVKKKAMNPSIEEFDEIFTR
jgi:hypothetical protein